MRVDHCNMYVGGISSYGSKDFNGQENTVEFYSPSSNTWQTCTWKLPKHMLDFRMIPTTFYTRALILMHPAGGSDYDR
jgi:hypothetical protein